MLFRSDTKEYEATLKRIDELETDRYNRIHGITQLGVESKPEKQFDIFDKKDFAKGKQGVEGLDGLKGKDASPKSATGSHSVTITISINKMIETFKISTTNLQESTSKVHEAVSNVLLQAINDSQIVANI